jgi:hypothetical protein
MRYERFHGIGQLRGEEGQWARKDKARQRTAPMVIPDSLRDSAGDPAGLLRRWRARCC